MLMSKGLICASGVIMCRMFLAICPPKRSLHRDVFLLADLGAALARPADPDLDPRFAVGARLASEEFRMGQVGREGEAGRPPGALTDPARAQRLQPRCSPADRGAKETPAALDFSEMIADDVLNGGDAVAESLEVVFGGAGKDLHQRAAADFACRARGKRRQ